MTTTKTTRPAAAAAQAQTQAPAEGQDLAQLAAPPRPRPALGATVRVQVAEGRRLRDPLTGAMHEPGAQWAQRADALLLRRLEDGDLLRLD